MGWQRADLWESGFETFIRFGLRTAKWSHLVHPCRSEWRILALTQQVWTDSTVTAQCYIIPARQGSENTSEQCSCTTEKQEVGGKYMWRFFSYSAVITAVERSSGVHVCASVCGRPCIVCLHMVRHQLCSDANTDSTANLWQIHQQTSRSGLEMMWHTHPASILFSMLNLFYLLSPCLEYVIQ